jgi:enoyl-CoA hydratase/carnithine racemase
MNAHRRQKRVLKEMTMDYPVELDGIRWEKSGKAGTIILDRPPMNTISFEGRSQIAGLVEAMDKDPGIRSS